MSRLGLSGISLPTLRALEVALSKESIRCPIARPNLLASGFGESAETIFGVLAGLSLASALAVVRVAIAERLHHPSPTLELVWSGPLAPNATSRDTRVVMEELFASAQREVIIGGFRFDAGADLFAPLHRVMVERGVRTAIFLDIEGVAVDAARGPAHARQRIDVFLRKNWPFGEPLPELFYDPRTAVPGPPWVSLHAKCVVVDSRRCLVTSANFTERGQTRNHELGVVIEDAAFSRHVVQQWRALVSAGEVVRAMIAV